MNAYDFFANMAQGLSHTKRNELMWLFRDALTLDMANWAQYELSNEEALILAQKADRLLNKGEPLAHILGRTEFFWSNIHVTPDVLIPRVETEFLCDIVSRTVDIEQATILDMCTGSGCIAVSLAKKHPDWSVTAVDISSPALKVARQNALDNGVKIEFIQSDMWQNVTKMYDCIISNPPYISSVGMQELPDSVKNFEPHLALYGGEDGLDFYRSIATNASKHLKKEGYLFLEIGEEQGEKVAELLKANFDNVKVLKDLFKKDRYVIARGK